jgi:acetylglutamate kinase
MKSVGMHPILVHGGGPAINDMLKKLKVESHFEQGLRVTDKETMEIVEMVLAGKVNKDIVGTLNQIGGKGIGLSGKDGNLIQARKKYLEKNGEKIDIGYVGEVEAVNKEMLESLIYSGYIPVISSIGMGKDGMSYNINADYVAGAVAKAVQANKFILLTDVEGIFRDYHDKDSLISRITLEDIEALEANGIISGGMVPKVDCCIDALKGGVAGAHIIDGRLRHSILLEVFFDEGIGTMIDRDKEGALN